MVNEVKNATALDLGGWGGAGIVADESVLGAPGRIVVTAAGNVDSPTAAVVAGSYIWVQGHHLGALTAVFDTAATSVLPLVSAAQGAASRGIPGTFNFSAGRVLVPVGATTVLVRGGGALLKPYVGLDGTRPKCGWRPGYHDNPDLNLPVWPDLPQPQVGGYSVTPTGMRAAFDTDSRVPVTMEVTASPWHVLRATAMLDMANRDRLQQFYESRLQPFWYVRPDTAQVCRAWWLDDGDPSDNGLGRSRTTSYGLLLEPA